MENFFRLATLHPCCKAISVILVDSATTYDSKKTHNAERILVRPVGTERYRFSSK